MVLYFTWKFPSPSVMFFSYREVIFLTMWVFYWLHMTQFKSNAERGPYQTCGYAPGHTEGPRDSWAVQGEPRKLMQSGHSPAPSSMPLVHIHLSLFEFGFLHVWTLSQGSMVTILPTIYICLHLFLVIQAPRKRLTLKHLIPDIPEKKLWFPGQVGTGCLAIFVSLKRIWHVLTKMQMTASMV